MKTCPICKSTSFDDMDVCFGCMHRFGEMPYSMMMECDVDEIDVDEPRIKPVEPMDKASDSAISGHSLLDFSLNDESLPSTEQGVSQGSFETVVPISGAGFNLVISVQPAAFEIAKVSSQ